MLAAERGAAKGLTILLLADAVEGYLSVPHPGCRRAVQLQADPEAFCPQAVVEGQARGVFLHLQSGPDLTRLSRSTNSSAFTV